jgi:hypothetical protein
MTIQKKIVRDQLQLEDQFLESHATDSHSSIKIGGFL